MSGVRMNRFQSGIACFHHMTGNQWIQEILSEHNAKWIEKGVLVLVKNRIRIDPSLFCFGIKLCVHFYRMEADPRFRIGYSRIELEENKKFSGIPVNTSMSTVHVPTNVFDGDPKVTTTVFSTSNCQMSFHLKLRKVIEIRTSKGQKGKRSLICQEVESTTSCWWWYCSLKFLPATRCLGLIIRHLKGFLTFWGDTAP